MVQLLSRVMNIYIKYSLFLSIILLLLLVPEHFIYHGHASFCMFKAFTGIECPLCGMTRASCDLLHFRLVSAIQFNPVSIFLPLLLLTEILNDIYPGELLKRTRRIVLILSFVGLGVLFILRIVARFTAS
jgi:hypothetical protein